MKNKILYILLLIAILMCVAVGIAIPALFIWLMIQKSVLWVFGLGAYGFVVLFFSACFTMGVGK